MDREESTTVAKTIADEIRRLGPMRFDRYMELALYSPDGYYEDPPVGAGQAGDFVTSPHVHPVFAQLVAAAIRDLHEAIGRPEPFELIEVGAGDGTMLRALMPELADLEARVIAVERSPGARAALEEIEGIEVRTSMYSATSPTIVLAHELLDNLPFRRLRTTPAGPQEVHVGLDGEGFVEVLVPIDDDLEPPVAPELGHELGRESEHESIVPVGAASFIAEALSGQPPGALLAIDYGSDHGSGGPAHGYRFHRVVEDLLAAPGETDITSGVDFGFLADAARSNGLQAFPTISQREALTALGLETWLRTELERQQDQLETGRGAAAVGTWGGRSRAAMLADPAGLGRFRWFVVTTPGIPEPPWMRAARGRGSSGA
jgi:SAM-dependent MidA family methyltransferase